MVAETNHQLTMIDGLLALSQYAQLSDVVVLILFQLLVRKRTAFSYIMFSMCALGFFHIIWEMYLSTKFSDASFKPYLNALWYGGFAITDFLFVIFAVHFCNRNGLVRDLMCNMIIITYTALGFIQCMRYLDRSVLQTNIMGPIYSDLIPALNIAVSASAIFYLLHLFNCLMKHYYQERF